MTDNNLKFATIVVIGVFITCTILVFVFRWFKHVEDIKRLETETIININKNNETIDVLNKTKDSLMIQVDNINTIKDAEIIKVKSLNNDSTLDLFYKLIREK